MTRAHLRDALLRGRNRPRATGAGSPTIYRGDGLEFVELREYVPGDDPRRIDWAATARSGALQSRVMLEDVALTLGAIVDVSASMGVGRNASLLDTALDALAAWYGAAQSDDRCVRVTSHGTFPPAGERGARAAALAASFQDRGPFDLRAALSIAHAMLRPGAALLVASDFFDLSAQDDAALAALGRRFDCTALLARDPWFDELPLRGFARMRDAESGEVQTVYASRRARDRYSRAVRERERALIERLQSANWRAAPMPEGEGEAALLRAFARR